MCNMILNGDDAHRMLLLESISGTKCNSVDLYGSVSWHTVVQEVQTCANYSVPNPKQLALRVAYFC
jgi:hypothetical protein